MKRILLLALFATSVLGCTDSSVSVPEQDSAAKLASFNTAGAPTVEYSVPDMMCEESCAKAVHETLAAQPGAKEVLVVFPHKTATVAVEEGKFDSEAALAALLDKQFSNTKLLTEEPTTEAPAAPAAPEEPAPAEEESQG